MLSFWSLVLIILPLPYLYDYCPSFKFRLKVNPNDKLRFEHSYTELDIVKYCTIVKFWLDFTVKYTMYTISLQSTTSG